MYTFTCIYKYYSESFKPQPERRAIAEHFCCGNTQPFLIKLIQISVLISVQVGPIQEWEVYNKSKIWMQLRTFWTTLAYVIYVMRRGSWCSGYGHSKWTWQPKFKFRTRLFEFHFMLMSLGKAWIYLFFPLPAMGKYWAFLVLIYLPV